MANQGAPGEYDPSAPPSVTFTGGGGAGAAGLAAVANSGKIVGVLMTNPGDNYTSAPAVTIGGGGSAVGLARINCYNSHKKKITLVFRGAATIGNSGNIVVSGSTFVAQANSVLTLIRDGNLWLETARRA